MWGLIALAIAMFARPKLPAERLGANTQQKSSVARGAHALTIASAPRGWRLIAIVEQAKVRPCRVGRSRMTGEELQATWRSLIRIFPVWSMPAEDLFSRTTWRFIGADLLAGPFGDRKSQKVADSVGPLPAETV